MKVSVDEIENSPNQTLETSFNGNIKGLETEGPVVAELVFKCLGQCINVNGRIVANVKLICDRCLNEFCQKLELPVDETYMQGAFNDGENKEIELKDGDFVIDLYDQTDIDVDDLLYQTLILNLPNPSVCDINCNGDAEMEKYIKKEISDPRLEVFKNMKIRKEGR